VDWSNSVEDLVNKDWFNNTIIIIIVFNTAFLASEHYDMPDSMKLVGDYANLVFTAIFFIEMILKLYGLGIN
jgi:hypothetical protein